MKPLRCSRFPWVIDAGSKPWCIAHRGASHYAADNSLPAFELAIEQGADWLEVDVRTTAEGILVVWHDPHLRKLGCPADTVGGLSVDELECRAASACCEVIRFDRVMALAKAASVGLYVDVKDQGAVDRVPQALCRQGIERAVIATFNTSQLAQLSRQTCPFPLAVLIPCHGDWVKLAEAGGADIVHFCWQWAQQPLHKTITESLLMRARARDLAVVLWHEERSAVLTEMVRLPVLGILTNTPDKLMRCLDDT